MEEMYAGLADFLKKPEVVETLIDIVLCAVPIWVAVMIGLVIGWSWRPRWTGLVFLGLRSRFRFFWTLPPGFGARRLWLAFTALSAFSVCRKLWSNFRVKVPELPAGEERSVVGDGAGFVSTGSFDTQKDAVTERDLEHLTHLLDGRDGDMVWQNQMERTTSNMSYQAWLHEHETSPIIYRSRTIFEDASPELVRDFFWDDDFRSKWDSMLAYNKILEEFPDSGTTIVHWVKKFPFFCSDREYIIARRIWESKKTYYCVTKGLPYPSLPKKEKPRRVELYFSSWRIRAVQSRRQDGQHSACEVTLVHYEDMGIPKDVAKVGVRHGMWGAVKKLQSGMRAYQQMRKTQTSLSRHALAAQITTKATLAVDADMSNESEEASGGDESNQQVSNDQKKIGFHGVIDWKWIAIGGVALACGLHSGLIGKALLIGTARRIGRN
ncbi:uncharacterized protein LOC110023301 [Phalaenopsis equestris]|uniref:uncharacterized protein LOC110023301 n=1 Tax=Phalaenopsis equestris TaxID=78828 RepID=UPI0009E3A49B|nr:uncharacterized protein LOC110023301 [Phalaenopsis equestris]